MGAGDGPSTQSVGTTGRASARDWVARTLGIDVASRERLVAAMMDRHERDVASYWLQLLLAMGIATLGLVLDSTGVVIGAMLVSPLMAPIVELGMALTTGSPFLVIRSSVRVVSSVAVVVSGAAALTLMLPFHEVTSEIAARTGPTVLDLVVAAFCAVAAAFTTARSSSDTTAAAAGTAISIALIPPLCVVGFGIGTSDWETASGSALLFTANFCAILLLSSVFFVATGFDSVHGWSLESDEPSSSALGASRAARRLRVLFGSRHGLWLRVLMPLPLVALVYVPLRSALEEVTWQVRVRGEVQRIVADVVPTTRTVQSAVTVERGAVSIRLVVVSSADEAARLESQLRTRVAAAAAAVPSVSVVAVTDPEAVRAQTEALRRRFAPSPVIATPPEPPDLSESIRRLATELVRAWPGGSAGPLLRWSVRTEGRTLVVTVEHIGDALGGAAVTLLGRELGARLHTAVSVVDRTYSPVDHVCTSDTLDRWLATLGELAAVAGDLPAVHLCLRVPPAPPPPPPPAPGRRALRPVARPADRVHAARPTVEAVVASAAPARVTFTESEVLAVRLSVSPCQPAPAQVGQPDAGRGDARPPSGAPTDVDAASSGAAR
ncbi:MAG: DUF389 domain-containing protein [Deltaproteobacteria bacterium]|nr:DUF389 domain-containing protein [Deltaproteobacteria bacterium]